MFDLSYIDRALDLRNRRNKMIGLRDAAAGGSLGDVYLHREGERFDVTTMVGEIALRDAIEREALKEIRAIEMTLTELGIAFEPVGKGQS